MTTRSNGWICLNSEHQVGYIEWRDDVAHCLHCGLTSDMTNAFAHQVRVRQREDDAQALRRLADQLTHNTLEWAKRMTT